MQPILLPEKAGVAGTTGLATGAAIMGCGAARGIVRTGACATATPCTGAGTKLDGGGSALDGATVRATGCGAGAAGGSARATAVAVVPPPKVGG